MTSQRSSAQSRVALDWLAATGPGQVLAVGQGSAATASQLTRLGSLAVLIDPSRASSKAIRQRYPSLTSVCAAPDALPFLPATFHQVVVMQGLHLLPALDALEEFARVLRPGGELCVVYTVRDDSVPWVRRLAALLRTYDPTAMTGGNEIEAVAEVQASAHFPTAEHRRFRRWVPITRDGMLELVRRSPSFGSLSAAELEPLLAEVGQLYDTSARQPEPLLLPYSVLCWRWIVDHSEFTSALHLPTEGLQINL